MTPDTGIRQVSPTIDGVRADHTARYRWAKDYVRNRTVVDYGCGIGYGSFMLAEVAASTQGVEIDPVAWQYAMDHYSATGADFVNADIMTFRPASAVAVAFEVIEHIEAPDLFLADLNADTLLVSVPNEHVFPFDLRIKHHLRHYTPEQFEQLLNDCGWEVTEWWAQEGPESEVEPNIQGRTQIAVAKRTASPQGGTWQALPPPSQIRYVVPRVWQHPTGRQPKSVHLVGLGPSKYALTELMLQHDYAPPWDELWTINTGIRMFPHADVAWIMDDVYDYATKHPAYGAEMRNFAGKIIGQTTIPNDGSIPFHEYPLREVLEALGPESANWLHTISVGYILAYARFLRVERLFMTGIDCSWPNRPDLSEAGNAIVAHWHGRLVESGCEVLISGESAFNQTSQRGHYGFKKYYGYLRQPA